MFLWTKSSKIEMPPHCVQSAWVSLTQSVVYLRQAPSSLTAAVIHWVHFGRRQIAGWHLHHKSMTFFEYKRFSSLALKRSGIALCLSDYSRVPITAKFEQQNLRSSSFVTTCRTDWCSKCSKFELQTDCKLMANRRPTEQIHNSVNQVECQENVR